MPRANIATRRLITTPRQRFKWLVNFAALDLRTLREGDLFNVREELRDFLLPLHSSLAPGGLHVAPDGKHPPAPEQYSLALLQDLQHLIREELILVVRSRATNAMLPYRKLTTLSSTAPHVPADKGAPGRHFWSVQGSVRDLVLLLLHHLLASQDTAMLAQCPECDKIFVKQTNQRQCSKACTSRVAGRAWRERHQPAVT